MSAKKKRSVRATGHGVPHPTCMPTLVRLLVPSRTPTKLAGRQPSAASALGDPATSPDAAKEGRTWPVAAAIVAHLSWCMPCAVPRCTCGNTTAAAHRAFHKQTGIGGTILSRATCQDSDKMMLAFSADRTTHLSLPRTAPLSRCTRRLQRRRLRPWQSPQSLPVSLCRAKTLALKGWHGWTSAPLCCLFFCFLAHPV